MEKLWNGALQEFNHCCIVLHCSERIATYLLFIGVINVIFIASLLIQVEIGCGEKKHQLGFHSKYPGGQSLNDSSYEWHGHRIMQSDG